MFITFKLDTSIYDFLLEAKNLSLMTSWAYITCLDSNHDISDFLLKCFPASPHGHGTIVGKGFLLPTYSLIMANKKDRLFFGYDEIFFLWRSNITPKPEDFSLVGPKDKIELSKQQIDWMSNSCYLGVGDGDDGMNCCLMDFLSIDIFYE